MTDFWIRDVIPGQPICHSFRPTDIIKIFIPIPTCCVPWTNIHNLPYLLLNCCSVMLIPQHYTSPATWASALNLSYHPALYFATAYFLLLLFTLSNTSYLPHLYRFSQSTPNSVVCLIVSWPQHYLSVIL